MARGLDQDYEELHTKLSFELPNKKKIIVFSLGESGMLYYVFLDTINKIELEYPSSDDRGTEKFNFHNGNLLKTLQFKNKNVTYIIHESPDALGITVRTKGKEYELTAIEGSKKDTLQELDKIKFDNVIIE